MVELALHLDPGADTPLYEQLYGALAGQIRTGRLAEGTRLPGKRSLAASLGLAVNTVDTAYQMLVAAGGSGSGAGAAGSGPSHASTRKPERSRLSR